MRIRNILLAAVVALFLTAPAPAWAVRYEVGQVHGLTASCLEDNGTYKVRLSWFARIVDAEGNVPGLLGNTSVEISRYDGQAGNPSASDYTPVETIMPQQVGEQVLMQWVDESGELVAGKTYHYKVASGTTGGRWTTTSVTIEPPAAPGRQDAGQDGRGAEYYQIFPPFRWEVVMVWYNALTILSGGFLLAVVVRSGYRYMLSAANPGLKASFVEDLQRCIVAMAVMALAPVFLKLIIGINDAFVVFFADIVNHMTAGRQGAMQTAALNPAGLFETVITAPLHIILALLNEIFGLDTINELVFNNRVEVMNNFSTPHTGNVFADVLLDLSMAGFNIYFNAFYTIRRWVVTIAFTATPIIVWIWALTAERQVLEIWLAEIFQTVFVQSAHALVLGTYLSILFATGTSGIVDGTWLTHGLAEIALWIAGFGGAVCVLVIVFVGYRIVTAEGEQEAAQAKESLRKALIGLTILGLALTIAGFLSAILAGRWS